MSARKKVEVFSAGCSACKETIETVKRLAGSHEVVVHDMNKSEVASKAKEYGIRTVPAVVIDGKLRIVLCESWAGPARASFGSRLIRTNPEPLRYPGFGWMGRLSDHGDDPAIFVIVCDWSTVQISANQL